MLAVDAGARSGASGMLLPFLVGGIFYKPELSTVTPQADPDPGSLLLPHWALWGVPYPRRYLEYFARLDPGSRGIVEGLVCAEWTTGLRRRQSSSGGGGDGLYL